MREIIIKFLIFCGMASIGGFIDAFLKDKGINMTESIFIIVRILGLLYNK